MVTKKRRGGTQPSAALTSHPQFDAEGYAAARRRA